MEENIDIAVVLDPKSIENVIVYKPYVGMSYGNNNDSDNSLIEGIIRPIIKINNVVIEGLYILKANLYNDRFCPYIHIEVIDLNKIILLANTPGVNNEITFIMTTPVLGAYRKIKLNFYCTSYTFQGNKLYCDGIFKFIPFDLVLFKAFPKSNTYSFLKAIAELTGLGFACTPKCSDVNDSHYRLILQKKYKDVIQLHIEFGGVDEQSIFDAWIDTFGYLTMVNVKHMFTSDINPENFKIKAILQAVQITDPTVTNPSIIEVPRVLSNFNKLGTTNLMIDSYNTIVNNSLIVHDGIDKKILYFDLNGIVTRDLQILQNNIDAYVSDDYDFKSYLFLGIEFDDIPVLYQKEIHDRYFNQIRSRQLVVSLNKPNNGLLRGMLITVIITDKNIAAKSVQKNNTANATEETLTIGDAPKSKTIDADILDERNNEINKTLSGIYYIDGIHLEYKNEKFTLKLFLIKRGEASSYINKYTKLQ